MACVPTIPGSSRVSNISTSTPISTPEALAPVHSRAAIAPGFTPTPAGGLILEPLPYRSDTPAWFGHLAGRPWAMLLDSGGDARGRYDIAVAEPRLTLVTRGPVTEIREGAGVTRSLGDPLDLVREQLGEPLPVSRGAAADLPFLGGAVGWLGYDLGRRFERLPDTAADPLGLPEMAVGLYDWALVVDHRKSRAWLAGRRGGDSGARAGLLHAYGSSSEPPVRSFRTRGTIATSLSAFEYRERFDRIEAYIQAGDCYQVNLARRFSVLAEGDAWGAYLRLRDRAPAPHGAFIHAPFGTVLSVSPERFLRVRGGRVQTSPIKGTAPRGASPAEDQDRARRLLASPKDRAENLMIVDLLRNDLGRTCAIGSVRVPVLFELQTFAAVHHLVSTVTGRLAPGEDALSLLRGAFPGGSITGAPKIRAMEVIEELEGERRGVYCGAIGYIGFDGAMDTSIAIRTAVCTRGRLWFWAGGGIVADSEPDLEEAEVLVKARAMLDLVAELGGEARWESSVGSAVQDSPEPAIEGIETGAAR